ncbi:MAG: snoRNA-binding rRNA-processing protein imp4 [Vezdaea aestivalis]|nr:MAG: snoRNA-binding rRNA-processing protein imp4 [Vezdaea aestivalis]
MIRRQARQRRDYLYRRALTLQQASTVSKHAALAEALNTSDASSLSKSLATDSSLLATHLHDASTSHLPQSTEDEYTASSGLTDPRPLITTSRHPSSRLTLFAKELRLLLPTSIRLNRGSTVLPNLTSSALSAGLSDILLLHEHRGTPTALTLSHLPHGPTASFSLHHVLLRHDIPAAQRGTVSESYPHLIFEGFTTDLGKRIVRMLQHIFPPREAGRKGEREGNRVVTFRNVGDAVEVRHHVFVRTRARGEEGVELAEVGPRLTMKCFEIREGALGEKEGKVEWALNQYARTARKKDCL